MCRKQQSLVIIGVQMDYFNELYCGKKDNSRILRYFTLIDNDGT